MKEADVVVAGVKECFKGSVSLFSVGCFPYDWAARPGAVNNAAEICCG